MMGINDFAAWEPRDIATKWFPLWKSQMDTVISTVFADGITKFAILVPATTLGKMDDYAGVQFNLRKNSAMWEARKLIIATYDNREGEGIHLVDTGSALDPDFGISMNQYIEKPFSDYEGTDTIAYTNNAPHPSRGGYYQKGIRLAAWIQSVR